MSFACWAKIRQKRSALSVAGDVSQVNRKKNPRVARGLHDEFSAVVTQSSAVASGEPGEILAAFPRLVQYLTFVLF